MKALKIIGRILLWFIIGIFILLIGIGIALQTRPVKNKIADIVQSAVNKSLDAELKIGRIDGDFFTNIFLKDVSLKQNNNRDTIAIIPEIKLNYKLLPLLKGKIQIESASLEKPYFSLVQYPDSTWNVMKIVRPSEKKDTVSGAFTMEIKAEEVKINDGSVKISSLIKQIPKQITNWFLDISLNYSDLKQSLNLRNMQFVAKEPDLVLKKLTFKAKRDTNSISLEKFMLKTLQNEIKADIDYVPNFTSQSVVSIQTAPLYLDEIKGFFSNLRLKPHPQITLKSELDSVKTHLTLYIKDKTQRLNAKLNAENVLQKFLQNKEVTVAYNLDGDFENIDLRDWLNNPDMKYILNGRLKAKGEGIDPKTMLANVEGNLNKSVVLNNRLDLAAFDLTLIKQRLTGYLNAAGSFGKLNVKPTVNELFEKNPRYNLDVNTQRLDLEKLLNNKDLKSNINFSGRVSGVGFDPKTMTAVVNGNFVNSTAYQQTIDRLNLDLKLARQHLTGQLSGYGNFGAVKAVPDVKNLFSDNPAYNIDLKTYRFNIAEILKDNNLNSNINLTGTFKGVGFDPKKMYVKANVKLDSSSAKGVNINELRAKLTFHKNQFDIQDFIAKTATIHLTADGVYSLQDNSDLNVNIRVKNGSEIAKFADLKGFETNGGTVKARLFGHPKDLKADVKLDFDSTRYQDFRFAGLKGNAATKITAKKKTLDADLVVNNFKTAGYSFKNISLTAKSNIDKTDLQLIADGTEIKTKLTSSLELGDETNIGLSNFLFDYKGYEWKLASPQAFITLGKEKYMLQDMKLISGSGDSVQVIYADGTINRAGNQDMKLQIQNVDLKKLMETFQINQQIEGSFYLDMLLKGTAANPLLTTTYNVKNASVSSYRFPRLEGNIDYAHNQLGLKSNIVPQDSGKLILDGTVPFEMRLDSMLFNLEKKKPISGKLLVEKFPLSIIKSFQPIDEAKGFFNGDIVLGGTVENPAPSGKFHLTDGALKWKKYGIDYRAILTDLNIQSDKIGVDTFYIRSRNGYMSAKGNAGFKSQFYLGDFKNSKIDVQFRNFNPLDHRLFNAQMSGDVSLQGVRDSLVFNGNVNLTQSLFYIPAIMNLMGKTSAPEISQPALIAELERRNLRPASVVFTLPYDSLSDKKKEAVSFNLFKSLQGKLKLNIPRNTWIRNEQLRLELMGDLDVYKHRDYFELFGTVDVVRGQYELLGKTFIVKSGNLAFEGGKDINPTININASYIVRTQDKVKRDLRILATGTLQKPEINFTLDGEQLSEGDAVSYILFGTSMDNVTSGQQISGGGNVSAQGLAGSAAASLISSQLTKLLGNTLNMDYIEFKTSGNFDQASFVVGKYITNKLFVSYEKRFGNYKDDNLNEYELRLEYELFKFLFLQLTSSPISNGIDAIVKLNSK